MEVRKLFVYFACIWLLLLLLLGVGIATGAGIVIAWSYDVVMILFVLGVTANICPCVCKQKADLQIRFTAGGASPSDVADEIQPASEEARPLPPQRPRMLWLDNLKTCLICCVVLGHTGMAFWGQSAGIGFPSPVGRSWFSVLVLTGLCVFKPLVVPLFFFISGFFVPSSLDRKGPKKFLKASFFRLGVAFLIFWLMLNPLMKFYCFALVQPSEAAADYFPTSPHTWFLLWLLVFQCGYATLEGPNVEMKLPSFGNLASKALCTALVQLLASVICLVVGASMGFAEMPMAGPGGDGFFNVVGFSLGVIAKRNNWLPEPLPAQLVRSARVYTMMMVLIIAALWITCFTMGWSTEVFSVVFVSLQIPLGPFCLAICVVVIDVFQTRFNSETPLSKFMASGAFAVYLLHYYLLNTFVWIFCLILEEMNFHLEFTSGTITSTQIGDAYCFGGLMFVFLGSLVTSFGLAGVLKMVPGLKMFL